MKLLALGLSLVSLVSPSSSKQDSWKKPYEDGLKAVKLARWQEARDDFNEADHRRHGDVEHASLTPGSPGEPLRWRNGAPYSPRFLSAYCEYRLALDSPDAGDQTRRFAIAAADFEKLVTSGERSVDAVYFLDAIYTRTKQIERRDAMGSDSRFKIGRHPFKVDEEGLTPEEVLGVQSIEPSTQIQGATLTAGSNSKSATVTAGTQTTGITGQAVNSIVPGLPAGLVPTTGDKYALIVGENGAQLGESAMGFAGFDAGIIRDGLTNYAGYPAANVVLVQNASSAEVLKQAKALAARVPQDAVVLFFYAGPGTNIQGKDYFSTADTNGKFDAETMVAKSELYQLFYLRGARLFSFYEVNRPIENGFYFGSETPKIGSVSQMEATTPDAGLTATVSNGHMVGLFAESFINVLSELKSNQIPIYEFGWQLYNKMRRGNSGLQGGGGHQIPTLPVLNNLASDARF